MKRILVKGVNWLGDAVMTLPAIRAIRARWPSAHVTVLTRGSLADLYACEPAVNETLAYGGGFVPFLKLVGRLRRQAFDAAFIFPRSLRASLAPFASRIPRRIGYAGDARKPVLTDVVARDGRLLTGHRVAYYLELLRPFGEVPAATAPEISPPAEAVDWARRETGEDLWAGVNPGATYGKAKQWYPERFEEIGRRLAARGYRVAVVGGPAEADLGKTVARGIGDAARDFSGKTTLPRLAALLARFRVFVTNDTGPMHVAAAVGTPVVAVFGPTDPRTTRPFGDRFTLVRHEVECAPCLLRECPIDHPCMRDLGVEQVWTACAEWIE
ncbi:MAG: lipopolysaccharide heptosyltransferase II [Candidatus Brocadiae bacterium]|nr:lipopolysaccharide heptosyltransferase II [Candidatus Brocadiia bacterium]